MDDPKTKREGGSGLTASISVVLVLVGIVVAGPLYHSCYFAMANSGKLFLLLLPVTLAMRFGGAMAVGAGLFLPIKKPWLGAAVGFAVQVMVTLAIYFTDPPD